MKKITAEEFQAKVELDPAWAATLTEPVEITGACDMSYSPISHLSPLLHFTGRNPDGDCANFTSCKNLKVAEGTFAGWVTFSGAGIEKIGGLTITNPDNNGHAANFFGCAHLKVAEGTYPGFVNFSNSGIQKIKGLAITRPNNNGWKADLTGCELRLPAEFLGPEYKMGEATRQKKLGWIAGAKATVKAQRTAPDLEI